MRIKKRGYFFVLDAMLGLSVLIIGMVLLLSLYVQIPPPTQVRLLSDDVLIFLSDTKIKDLNNPYAGIGGELWKQELITDQENSLLQQIGEFYYKNKPDIAEKFIQNVSEPAVPPQFRYEVWIDNTRIYPANPSQDHTQSKSKTTILLTSKKLTFGISNKTTSDIWGPYKAEVFAWQK